MVVVPHWRFEQKAGKQGFARIAGIDEAGRGPLAGPVVAAAVVFAPGFRMKGLADSKQLSAKRREELSQRIRERALAVGVGIASAEEIDRLNILAATHLAAQRAVKALGLAPDYLITDCLKLEGIETPVEAVVGGDQLCASVAAASIIAKVERDRLMCGYDDDFPGYGFSSHKGYGTEAHLDALRTLGPTTIHRLTFRGVAWFESELRHSKTFEQLAEAVTAMENEKTARALRVAIGQARVRLPEREQSDLEALFKSRLARLKLAG